MPLALQIEEPEEQRDRGGIETNLGRRNGTRRGRTSKRSRWSESDRTRSGTPAPILIHRSGDPSRTAFCDVVSWATTTSTSCSISCRTNYKYKPIYNYSQYFNLNLEITEWSEKLPVWGSTGGRWWWWWLYMVMNWFQMEDLIVFSKRNWKYFLGTRKVTFAHNYGVWVGFHVYYITNSD